MPNNIVNAAVTRRILLIRKKLSFEYNAKLLAKELAKINEVKIDLNKVHTNIIFFL